MNFIRGRITPEGFLTEEGTKLPLPAHVELRERQAVYGIRPEHLSLGETGIGFAVDVVEPTGSETLLIGRIGAQDAVCLSRERLALEPGTSVTLAPSLDAVHLFDAETGLRLN